MRVLCVDVGSSSIKAAWCKNGKVKTIHQVDTPSITEGRRVEIDADHLIKAFEKAIREVMKHHKHVDAIAIDTLCPGIGLADGHGKPLTNLITHQDRRSFAQAAAIEKEFGKSEHQRLTGNRPIPGGIGSTSLLWLKENQPDIWKQKPMVIQPTTLLVHHLTGKWSIDPSQAAFTGLYDTPGLKGWVPELVKFLGLESGQLPTLLWADEIAGTVTEKMAERLGVPEGTPVLPGIVDTSAAVMATDGRPGRLVHSSGSSDVLALVVDACKPTDHLLWRPLGAGRHVKPRWLAVSTMAAGGSSIKWMRDEFFKDISHKQFWKLLEKVIDRLDAPPAKESKGAERESAGVQFEALLAGDRTSLEERRGAFDGLTLATTREDMLAAVVQALTDESRQRLQSLQAVHKIEAEVYVMGGEQVLAGHLHRHWPEPKRWKFTPLAGEAMPGLAKLAELALRK
jgi:xylulokinase